MGRNYSFLILFCIFLGSLASGKTVVLGVRDDEKALVAYAKNKGIAILASHTKEFDNGNTFVRFTGSAMNRDIVLLLPASLTPNTLMEALIKIRTARANGAREIRVLTPYQTSLSGVGFDHKPNFTKLFAIAGADILSDQGLKEDLLWSKARKGHQDITKVKRAHVLNLSHGALAEEISQSLNLPLLKSEKDLPKIELSEPTAVLLIAPPAPPVNQTFFDALSTMEKLIAKNARVSFVTPYLPYARSDKKDQPGVAIIGRLIADLIEQMGAKNVLFVRAHAAQSEGFFSIPTFHVNGRATINSFLKERKIDLVISPDAGFQKDATLYADELKVPVVVLNKQRDPVSGEAHLVEMGGIDLTGKTVAIIDDETGSGKTMLLGATFLKSKGVRRVIGVVTHLTGAAAEAVNSDAVDEIVVTNTFPITLKSPKLKVLNIGPEIVAALKEMTESFASKANCKKEIKKEE